MEYNLAILVAKVHVLQRDHRRRLARKLFISPHRWSSRAIPFILFQQSDELRQNIWTIFRSNCLFEEGWSRKLFSRLYEPDTDLWRK